MSKYPAKTFLRDFSKQFPKINKLTFVKKRFTTNNHSDALRS